MAISSLPGSLGDSDADFTDHDTYTQGVPYAVFAKARSRGQVVRVDEHDGGWHWAVLGHAEIGEVGRAWERFTTTAGIRL